MLKSDGEQINLKFRGFGVFFLLIIRTQFTREPYLPEVKELSCKRLTLNIKKNIELQLNDISL